MLSEFGSWVQEQLFFLDYAPVIFTSALTGFHLDRLLEDVQHFGSNLNDVAREVEVRVTQRGYLAERPPPRRAVVVVIPHHVSERAAPPAAGALVPVPAVAPELRPRASFTEVLPVPTAARVAVVGRGRVAVLQLLRGHPRVWVALTPGCHSIGYLERVGLALFTLAIFSLTQQKHGSIYDKPVWPPCNPNLTPPGSECQPCPRVLQHVVHVLEPPDELVALEVQAELAISVEAHKHEVDGHRDVDGLHRG